MANIDIITPKERQIRKSIDEFVEIHGEIKARERSLQKLKNTIMTYAKVERAKRIAEGKSDESFKIEGLNKALTFVITDGGAAIPEDSYLSLLTEFGEVANDLLEVDIASVKFNPTVLMENLDEVIEALNTLPTEVISNLFLPPPRKIKKGATARVGQLIKEEEKILDFLEKSRNTVKLQPAS